MKFDKKYILIFLISQFLAGILILISVVFDLNMDIMFYFICGSIFLILLYYLFFVRGPSFLGIMTIIYFILYVITSIMIGP